MFSGILLDNILNGLYLNKNLINNNLKVEKKSSYLSNLFKLPKPHGVHNSFVKEIKHFSKNNWLDLFNNEGYKVVNVIKGPFYSGYGFGIKSIEKMFMKTGICSEYIYILKQ
jgi:hypothetical protein